MSKPTDQDIQIAFDYALWLRSERTLDATDRMVCDLGHEVQALREGLDNQRKRAEKAEAELAEAKKALGKLLAGPHITLTVSQIIEIADFYSNSDEEPDSKKRIRQLNAWKCSESGELQPAGIYVEDEEYPEHGLMGPFESERTKGGVR